MATDPTIGVEERELDDAALEALAEAYATPAPVELRARVLAIAATPAEGDTAAADLRVRRARIVGAIASSNQYTPPLAAAASGASFSSVDTTS